MREAAMCGISSCRCLLLSWLFLFASAASAQTVPGTSPDPLDRAKAFARNLFEATVRTPQEWRDTSTEISRTSLELAERSLAMPLSILEFELWLVLEAELTTVRTDPERAATRWRMWELRRLAKYVAERMHEAGGGEEDPIS